MDQEPTDNNPVNGDGDKQILASTDEGPRENLISTAIKFLQNPKVMASPLYQKRAFLEKKGLTQEEIKIAVERSGVKETTDGATMQTVQPVVHPPGALAVSPYPPPGYVPIPPQSGWAKARDLTMTTVIVASVSYAVYQLFNKYLRPLLLGKSAQEKRLERLEKQIGEIQKSVTDSLAEVTRTLSAIQVSLNNQQTQMAISGGEVRGISDLKSDIASLKGLLLNRSQFPPVPSTSPVLPSWQKAQTTTIVTSAPAPATITASASSSYAEVVKTSSMDKGVHEDPSISQSPDLRNGPNGAAGDFSLSQGDDGYCADASKITDLDEDRDRPDNKDGEESYCSPSLSSEAS